MKTLELPDKDVDLILSLLQIETNYREGMHGPFLGVGDPKETRGIIQRIEKQTKGVPRK